MSDISDPSTSASSSEKKNGKPRGKYKSLSIQDKLKVLDRIDEGGSMRTVCEEFNLSTTTYYDIKKSKEKLRSYLSKLEGLPLEDPGDVTGKRKRVKAVKYSELDQAVLQWCQEEQAAGVLVRGVDLISAAERFAAQLNIKDFMASRGWLHKFRSRHCLTKLATQKRKQVREIENSSHYTGAMYSPPLIHEFWSTERGTLRQKEDNAPDTKNSCFDKEGTSSWDGAVDDINDPKPGKRMDFSGMELNYRNQSGLIPDNKMDSADSERSYRSPISKEEEIESIAGYSAGHIHFLSENEKGRGNSVQNYHSTANYSSSREHSSEIMTLRQEILLLRAMLENELKKNLSLQQKNEELQQKNLSLQHYLDAQRLCREPGHGEDLGRTKEFELPLGSKDVRTDHNTQQTCLDDYHRKTCIEAPGATTNGMARSMSTEAELLGDEKPATLVESYRKVYCQERNKALEALDAVKDLKATDELKSQILLSIVVLAFKSSSRSLAHIHSEVYRLLQVHPQQLKGTEQEVVKEQEDAFIDKLRSHTRALDLAIRGYITANISQHDLSGNTEEVCEQIYSSLADYPAIRDCEEVTQFIRTCTRLAWALTSQSPPFVITHDSHTFRSEEHIRFPMSLSHGSAIKMYHWPALLEGPGGPCVSRAIVVTH